MLQNDVNDRSEFLKYFLQVAALYVSGDASDINLGLFATRSIVAGTSTSSSIAIFSIAIP